MSMITSCPACGTMFRVVPDQLKISEGWVRCGHCAEVFDATSHLADESILDAPPAEQATRPAELPTRPLDLVTQPAELPKRPELLQRRSEPVPASEERSVESSSFFGDDEDSQSLEPSPLDTPFVFRPSDLIRQSGDSSMLSQETRFEGEEPEEDEDEPPSPGLEKVSFVRQARRKAFGSRPMVRIAMAFLSVGLAVLLVLQLAYQDRDRLAQAQPTLRPALERMCDALGCTLGAPRQIESLVIESSGFNRLRADTYRLAFTLRNTSPLQVAAPAMELTVTDAQDQPIARRVITPAEFGSADVIAAGSEWSRSIGLVLGTSGTARVAGYRLLAFYP
jgi:predicted Zn finger-like uncharacterized protein